VSILHRTLASVEVIPFTPATYDTAFRNRTMPGLPQIAGDGHLALPFAYACTVAISEDIAKIPLPIFEQSGSSKDVARNHPVYDLLQHQSNEKDTAIAFREWMTAMAVNRGRGVAEIRPGPRGPVDQLIPLHPDRYVVERIGTGESRLRYDDPIKGTRFFTRDQLFILNGRFGTGVVSYARRNFELQLAMQQLASEMYGRGLRSPGYLSVKSKMNREARKLLREALDEYMGGGERAGRPMLLDEGAEWKTTSITLEDAEFLATMRHGGADVCRWYRVPQSKAQQVSEGTMGPIQQAAVDWVVDGLQGHAIRWEQAIRRDLILNPRFFAEHNFEGLLRGDTKTRYEAYQIAVSFGWMTRAEVRDRENLNPIPGAGLEKPLLPLNMAAQVAGGNPGVGSITPSSGAVVGYLRLLVRDGAARIVRKETATLGKLAEKAGEGDEWRRGVRDFYREHTEFTARVLRIPDAAAAEWADARCAELVEHGPSALDYPETDAIADLTELALDKSAPLQLPATPSASTVVRSVLDLVELEGVSA
jgi:HK97 family phage portal protein